MTYSCFICTNMCQAPWLSPVGKTSPGNGTRQPGLFFYMRE
ncbi:hypothetical protein BN439_2311 [Erwinia amylovora Ea644]|nr:hypothetical protein BN439_2311 [Erwinia amylovora Ea644]